MLYAMVGEFADFFTQLFLGSGAWLGLLILVMFFLLMRVVNKYSVIISFPICLLVGFEYLANDLGWHSLIIWLASVVILITAAKDV
jgi:glucan phosphoethanolaminetransferase (alkaline phosphatase superfamily)